MNAGTPTQPLLRPWPEPPSGPGETIPETVLERYKHELDAHLEAIKALLTEEAAAAAHRRSLELAEQKAAIDAAAAEAARVAELHKAERSTRDTGAMEFHKAYVELAKGSIDRMQKRAELLQAAAVAIGTLYTGLLAYFYHSVDAVTAENISKGDLLPTRGIIPVCFLGAAIVFAMAYTAFRTQPKAGDEVTANPQTLAWLEQQRNLFVDWAGAVPWWRIKLVQLAVLNLGMGVATLPIALVKTTDGRAFERTGWATAILFAAVLILPWLVKKLPWID